MSINTWHSKNAYVFSHNFSQRRNERCWCLLQKDSVQIPFAVVLRDKSEPFPVCSITQEEKHELEPQFVIRVPTIQKRLRLLGPYTQIPTLLQKTTCQLHLDPNVCPSSTTLDDLDVSWIIPDFKMSWGKKRSRVTARPCCAVGKHKEKEGTLISFWKENEH